VLLEVEDGNETLFIADALSAGASLAIGRVADVRGPGVPFAATYYVDESLHCVGMQQQRTGLTQVAFPFGVAYGCRVASRPPQKRTPLEGYAIEHNGRQDVANG
jgi:hypothetical protein